MKGMLFATAAVACFVCSPLFAGGAEARTYYVARTGSDSNSCATAQTISTPKLTISAGVACAFAGDTVYIRAGVYDTGIQYGDVVNPGTDWGSGAITIGAYPSETVTIAVGNESYENAITLSGAKYLIFDHLILDGTGSGDGPVGLYVGPAASHIRFQNGEIKNFLWHGILAGSDNIQILRSRIHHNGHHSTPHSHGIYYAGSDGLFEGNEVYNNAGSGLVIYNVGHAPSRNVVQGNWFHHNCIYYEAELFISGDANAAYNNIFSGPRTCPAIQVEYDTPTNTLIYNNTFVHDSAIVIGSDASGTLITNNILRRANNAGAGAVSDNGSGTALSNNFSGDPLFVDPSVLDFRLKPGSPAIDMGVSTPQVVVDFNGVQRPQGNSVDIGAFEYTGAAPLPPPAAGAASFVGVDVTTQGNWQGAYGGDGFRVVSNYNSYPGYARVSTSGVAAWRWSDSTDDPRALRKATNSNERIAATLYSGTTLSIDVNLSDGATHRVALYFLDWDSFGRSQRIQVVDGTSLAVLDTRTVSGFSGGQYLLYDVTGHVTFQVTRVAGVNAVVSGIFFGGPVTAPPIPPTAETFWISTSSTVTPGAPLPVSFGIPSGSPKGFFALYAAGDDVWWSYKAFIYPPPGATSGTVVFTAPYVAGSYQVRFVTEYDALAKAVAAFSVP